MISTKTIGFSSMLFLLSSLWASAQHTLNFELLTGPVYNFPTKLIIHQEGYETIRHSGRYVSKPFKLPPYYDIRISLWHKDSSAWGLKFTHHKIQQFEITHGYNILSLTRIWKRKGFTWNTALGVVLANPESVVRGQHFQGGGLFDDGYYFAGAVAEAAVGKHFNITRNWYLSAEIRLTAAWARVHVNDGYADVPNVATHLLFGTGYRIFTGKGKK